MPNAIMPLESEEIRQRIKMSHTQTPSSRVRRSTRDDLDGWGSHFRDERGGAVGLDFPSSKIKNNRRQIVSHYFDLSPPTESFPEGSSKANVSARVAQLVAAAEIHWSGP